MKKSLIYFCYGIIFYLTSCQKEITKQSYLALGDSYTIGESIPEKESWPLQLVDSLSKRNIFITAPKLIAKTGWTTDELKVGIDNSSLNFPYDWVSLMIGVNNQYRGGSKEDFKSQFEILLSEAIAFSGNRKERVFVVSIPDWGLTPFAEGQDRQQIASEIDDFNQIIYEICAYEEIPFIDVTTISRKVNIFPEWIAPDSLHPSGAQYSEWVKQIIPVFLNINDD